MNKRKNYLLAVLLLTFILVGVFGFDYIITQIITTTGKVANDPGKVSVTILAGPEPPPPVSRTKSGIGTKRELSLQISTPNKKNIRVLNLEAEEKKEKQIVLLLKNTGAVTLNLELENTFSILSINKKTLTLRPEEETTILLTIYSTEVGISTGIITFTDKFLLTQLPTVIKISPKKAAYTVDVTIPQQFKIVQPGDDVLTKIKIDKLNGQSIVINYLIKDMLDRIIHEEHERIGVTKELTLDKTISLPDNIDLGEYAFIATVDYQGASISDVDTFTIAEEATLQKEQPQKTKSNKVTLLLLVLFLILVTHLLLQKIRKH